LFPRHLPFIRTNTSIHYFRHAVALDERRAKFIPSFYHKDAHQEHDSDNEAEAQEDTQAASKTMLDHVEDLVKIGQLEQKALDFAKELADRAAVIEKQGRLHRRPTREKTSEAFELEHLWNTSLQDAESDAKEVWFAGVHTGASLTYNPFRRPSLIPTFVDVGGGSVANETRHSLGECSLRRLRCYVALYLIPYNSSDSSPLDDS
jgi:hypothetical protein